MSSTKQIIDEEFFKALSGGKSPIMQGELGTIDGGYIIITHSDPAIDLAKPFDPNELDDDAEVDAQPKTERMRDWKQK